MKKISFLLSVLLISLFAKSQSITLDQVTSHIGKQVTVCGKVSNIFDDYRAKGHPTLIDMGANYPNEQLTVLVWGEKQSLFTYKLQSLNGTNICITGTIKTYRGRPEIVVSNPDQITKE